jgi:thiamine biosynthesis lipoprotein
MNKLNRRSFLKLSALAGLGAAAGIAIAKRETIESVLLHDGMYRVSVSRPAIGTHVDITAIGKSKMQTEDAVAAAFDHIARYENLFTRYDHKSPVCELNETGRIDHIDDDLFAMLQTCDAYHRDTNGAFDITVKPCIDLFKACADAGRKPTEAEIAQIVPRIGADKLRLSANGLYIPEGMGITLDGVAPGFIADRVAQLLQNSGIHNYLVNAGGEIRTAGKPLNGQSWRIAIQDPSHQNNYPGFIALNEGAVSTSGNYEIFFGPDRMYHHIVNASTGKSPNTSVSVTVTAPTATQADILSTALFVMTPQQALDYTARHPEIACLIIDSNGNQIASPNFKFA